MLNIAVMMLAASAFLLNPPTGVSWGYAELNLPGTAEPQTSSCGVRDVAVFSARASQIATDNLSDEQRDAVDDLVGRLEEEWVDASRAERARLSVELMDIASAKNTRSVQQIWVKLDSVLVHYLMVIGGPTGNILVKLEDEVNGVLRVLDHEMPARRGQAQEVLAALWPNLPEGEGRSRLEMAISVIRKVVESAAEKKEKNFSGAFVSLHNSFDSAPEDPCLTDGAAIAGFQRGGSTMGFEAPPEDIIDEFFGIEGLPLPDPDWSYERLKKEIL